MNRPSTFICELKQFINVNIIKFIRMQYNTNNANASTIRCSANILQKLELLTNLSY